MALQTKLYKAVGCATPNYFLKEEVWLFAILRKSPVMIHNLLLAAKQNSPIYLTLKVFPTTAQTSKQAMCRVILK